MKKVSFMKLILTLGIVVCGMVMVSCAEEEIAPTPQLLGTETLLGDGSNDNKDGDTGTNNDDLVDADVYTGDGNDNADGETGNDNDDVVDLDASTTDGNDNTDDEKGNDNDDVVDIDVTPGDGSDNADGENGNSNDDLIGLNI